MPGRLCASALLVAVVVISGCGNRINYLPRHEDVAYPPTTKVEIIFEDPPRPYEEIGMISVESDDWSEEKMFRKLRDKAKSVGADAILMRGNQVRPGETSRGGGGVMSYGSGFASGVSYAVTEDVRRMEGLAIRYKAQ